MGVLDTSVEMDCVFFVRSGRWILCAQQCGVKNGIGNVSKREKRKSSQQYIKILLRVRGVWWGLVQAEGPVGYY